MTLRPKEKTQILDENGSISIIVTILISSTLLFGLFMAVADVSTLYAERRVVQNAADSAVLALAGECASGGYGAIAGNNNAFAQQICLTSNSAKEFAEYYANINSPDQITSVVEVCGSFLGTCESQPDSYLKCQSIPPQYSHYVRIVTRSQETSGSPITPIFSQLFDEKPVGVDVFGCAQAAWGNSGSATVVFPFSFSICDYQRSGEKVVSDFPANSPTIKNGCSVTDLSNVTRNYSSPLSGFAMTENFGCPGSATPKTITVGDLLTVETSLSRLENICVTQSQFYQSLSTLAGKKIIVPAVGSVECNSQTNDNCRGNFEFRVAGFFSFNFLGGKFENRGIVGSAPTTGWPNDCGSSRSCIYGNFDEGFVTGGSITTSSDVADTGTKNIVLFK